MLIGGYKRNYDISVIKAARNQLTMRRGYLSQDTFSLSSPYSSTNKFPMNA
jgi:hypothetical protein